MGWRSSEITSNNNLRSSRWLQNIRPWIPQASHPPVAKRRRRKRRQPPQQQTKLVDASLAQEAAVTPPKSVVKRMSLDLRSFAALSASSDPSEPPPSVDDQEKAPLEQATTAQPLQPPLDLPTANAGDQDSDDELKVDAAVAATLLKTTLPAITSTTSNPTPQRPSNPLADAISVAIETTEQQNRSHKEAAALFGSAKADATAFGGNKPQRVRVAAVTAVEDDPFDTALPRNAPASPPVPPLSHFGRKPTAKRTLSRTMATHGPRDRSARLWYMLSLQQMLFLLEHHRKIAVKFHALSQHETRHFPWACALITTSRCSAS